MAKQNVSGPLWLLLYILTWIAVSSASYAQGQS